MDSLSLCLNDLYMDEDKEEKDEDMADEAKNTSGGDKTVQDVFDSMTEEQKNVCYFMIGQALEDAVAAIAQ